MDLARKRDGTGSAQAPRAGVTEPSQRSLRIAGIDPEHGFSGGESQVMGLTRGLRRAGHSVELICDPAGALWARAQAEGIGCHPLSIRNSVDIRAGLGLRSLLRSGRYDIVHFHTARAHSLAPYARGRAGALIVTRRMDYVPNRLFAPLLFNRAVDGVAAISNAVAGALAQAGVRGDRIAIIPSGVDCERFAPPDAKLRLEARSAIPIGPDDIAIGIVGALTPRKGHSLLLKALALAGKASLLSSGGRRRRLICFIAGAGPSRDAIVAEISSLGLGEMVKLVGGLEDPRPLLWAIDIFAMPSRMEGLGVAGLEAMACGVPVVACAAGGLREAVEHGRTGWLVAPDDAHVMADAITNLATKPELRASMGAKARETVVAKFSMENMVQGTLELYRSSLNSARKTSYQNFAIAGDK
jgi:glycosyltransferase involved in cell wall biosynthesis